MKRLLAVALVVLAGSMTLSAQPASAAGGVDRNGVRWATRYLADTKCRISINAQDRGTNVHTNASLLIGPGVSSSVCSRFKITSFSMQTSAGFKKGKGAPPYWVADFGGNFKYATVTLKDTKSGYSSFRLHTGGTSLQKL